MEEVNTVYGEVDVADASVGSAQHASADELIEKAEKMWELVKTELGIAGVGAAAAPARIRARPDMSTPSGRAAARSQRIAATRLPSAAATPVTPATPAAPAHPKSPPTDAELSKMLERLHKREPDFAQSFPLVLRWMVHVGEYNSEIFRTYLTKFAETRPKTREEFRSLQVDYPVALWKSHNPRHDGEALKKFRTSLLDQLKEEDELFEKSVKEAEAEVARVSAENTADRRRLLAEFLRSRTGTGTV
jgi:hypothetical protein